MLKRSCLLGLGILCAGVASLTSVLARTADVPNRTPSTTASAAFPIPASTNHDVGKIQIGVTNEGVLGAEYASSKRDYFTNEPIVNCRYPKNSSSDYLYGGSFWIGAVVGRDTLVSTGDDGWALRTTEFHGFTPPIYRSTLDPSKPQYFRNAVSEQDYVMRYYDTCRTCPGTGSNIVDGRGHRPINLQIDQTSMAWSYSYAEDFVLFDYKITNIGTQRIRRCYIGIYIDADVADIGIDDTQAATDDLCGFLESLPAQYGPVELCPAVDTVNIAWIADADGDFGNPLGFPVPSVTATRIVRTPQDSLEVSFNWWVSNGSAALDFGPQTKQKVRIFPAGNLGTPEGDRAMYHQLRNTEFDYDQAFTAAITADDPVWYPPSFQPRNLADGFDTRYFLSFGPFDIDPGQALPLSFAYLAGEDFHTIPDNARQNLEEAYNPEQYYANLDFSDLGYNATWASWIYDNPGVDSDSDGYAGKFRICMLDFTVDSSVIPYETTYSEVDTTWYEGDGVPDFRGASPPPAPFKWITTDEGRITVRFNGERSESAEDVFNRGVIDFEGYRIYYGRDERSSSFTMLRSYDRENFAKWTYDPISGDFKIIENPSTLEQLRFRYGNGNPNWDPLSYTRSNPYADTSGEIFYFEKQDFNQSSLTDPDGIRKLYPNAPKPPDSWKLSHDSIPSDSVSIYLTDDGHFRFYEYEYVIDDLLESIPYFVNVTAFDFGSPQTELPSLETSVSVGAVQAYALSSVADVQRQNKKVFTWPNPYRLDGGYLAEGFERQDFERGFADDRLRRIHFANLPARCRISIYSLDGDLIREINHDKDPNDPSAMHAEWDLISRNTQMVASGLYYWTVEDLDSGNVQIGKIAIIL